MSALEAVRKNFGNLELGTSKSSKSPSAGSAGASHRDIEKFVQFSPELERRIRSMASRWSYNRDELAEVIALARKNPHSWQVAVALDERRFGISACPAHP